MFLLLHRKRFQPIRRCRSRFPSLLHHVLHELGLDDFRLLELQVQVPRRRTWPPPVQVLPKPELLVQRSTTLPVLLPMQLLPQRHSPRNVANLRQTQSIPHSAGRSRTPRSPRRGSRSGTSWRRTLSGRAP